MRNTPFKIYVIVLLIATVLGCGKEEKLEDKYRLVKTIKVEGICGEDHTTVKGKYSGDISLYYVKDKDTYSYVGLLFRDRDPKEGYEVGNLYKYELPPSIVLNKLTQEDLIGDELHLKGISKRSTPEELGMGDSYAARNWNSKSYESTCVLKVIERIDHSPSSKEEQE